MFRNFFSTAYRNLIKYKTYSVINLIGLTCGLTLSLLIIAYVRSELSYDRFHEKAERLYRIRYEAPNGLLLATSPPPIAPAMKTYFPEVEETARVYGRNVSIQFPGKNESVEETGVYFADSTLTSMFSFSFVKGDPRKALKEKFTVLINEEMAKKYFGDRDPIGESLLFGGKHAFRVSGVLRNFPDHSHLRFNMLVPYENMFDMENDQTAQVLRKNLDVNFIISHSYTYVLLKPGTDPDRVDQKMDDFIRQHAKPELQVGQKFTLMPLTDIHLHSTLLGEPSTTSSMANILIFIGVGLLTLVIACINYINLSTAQSFTRIREIGIRKVLGSMKSQLILQFLAESLLFCFLAMCLAYAVFYATLPLLNDLTNKNLSFNEAVDQTLVLASAGLLVLITLLAGGYPSYFVSQFNSIHSLKGAGITQYGSQFLRRVLVVFQLTIACLLVSGSLIIVKQLHFLQNRPLGFEKDNVITIPLFSNNLNGIFQQNDSTLLYRIQGFRHRVESLAGIEGTSLSSDPPGVGVVFRGTVPEGFSREDRMFIANMAVDYDFFRLYEMQLSEGRVFSEDHLADSEASFIVNETAVKEFNWGSNAEAIGKKINLEGKEGQVVGILRDFNFTSLTTPVSAMVLELNTDQFNTLSVRLSGGNVGETLERVRLLWGDLFPEKAFEFNFLDQQLSEQYNAYQEFGTIIQLFSAIAMLISCLGVYGLILFVVQRKVKEIGVRKVLGATVPDILALLCKDFAWLILIGFVLAVPLSFFLLEKWLENFSYHTGIGFFTYLASLGSVMLIVGFTISWQAVKAAVANPVHSLRSE